MPIPRNKRSSSRSSRPTRDSIDVSLPTGISEPVSSLSDVTILIHGEPKIGKTSFCSKFPDALFLMFEPGGKGLRIASKQVENWKQFVGILGELKKSDRFKTIIIDTVDIAYERCFSDVCKREGWDHPQDAPFGKGWNAIEKEFTDQMTALLQLGRGVVFISHTQTREFNQRTGGTYSKLTPSMANQARSYVGATVDLIGYYGFYGEERYLTVSGSDSLDAGHRLEERFWIKPVWTKVKSLLEKMNRTSDKEALERLSAELSKLSKNGRVHSVPMGLSAQEGYVNFVKAFHNEQENTGEPETSTGLSEAPVKREATTRRGRR